MRICRVRRTELTWEDCEPYLFASEIAWRQMIDRGHESLDSILCDPGLAEQFDQIASQWAPNFQPLQYRWAALKLRKKAKEVRDEADILNDASLCKPIALDKFGTRQVPESSGVYVVVGSDEGALYAGETSDLRSRLEKTRNLLRQFSRSLVARYCSTACKPDTRLAYQRRLVCRHRPILNYLDQMIA